MTGPLPSQVCTWLPSRSTFDPEPGGGASDGQWLYCLKSTDPGDRQVVWRGRSGDGFVAVVDFSGDVQPRPGGYSGWGRITPLSRFVTIQEIDEDPVLATRFGPEAGVQNVRSLNAKDAIAIGDLAGGYPPSPGFVGFEADWSQKLGVWNVPKLPPERITEEIVLDKGRLARKLGFPSNVTGQKMLANGRRPDLWCRHGVVGEVKNQITAAWGPAQIEDYIEQCDRQWPEYNWRGVLVQGVPAMAPNAPPRLRESRYRERISVWTVQEGRFGRIKAEQIYPG